MGKKKAQTFAIFHSGSPQAPNILWVSLRSIAQTPMYVRLFSKARFLSVEVVIRVENEQSKCLVPVPYAGKHATKIHFNCELQIINAEIFHRTCCKTQNEGPNGE